MKKDTFEPVSLNIKELFGNTNSLFQIPNYQRPYSWQDEEVERLWDDVYTAFVNNYEDHSYDENYFLGSIICVPHPSGYSDIVDGQQRLTTLMILLCVVRDLYPKLHDEVDIQTNPDFIKISRIKKCIYDEDDRSRLKLMTHVGHQNDFENLIIKKVDFETLKKPTKKKINSNPQSRFVNTAFIFKNKLEEIGEKQAGLFINYLFNKVGLIKITCTDRAFSIKLFQVLNDRGMPLTSSDLIKSYLISKLTEEKHGQFIADWQKIESISEDAEVEMDELWTLYEYYQLGANPKKSLSDEIIEIFKNVNPNEAINDFKQFSIIYRDQVFETRSKVVFSLWYIHWEMYWKMITLTSIKTGYSFTDELLKSLRRFYYLNWIAGKTLTTIKQTSFNVVKWIKEKKDIEFIKNEFELKMVEDKIYQLVEDELAGDVYFERWLKPLLLTVEYQQTDESKLDFIYLDNSLHVEHILPVEALKFKEWDHFSKDDVQNKLHTLGNLTLLSGKKNIEASNNPFDKKLEIYKGFGKYKNKKEGLTSFLITQKIINDQVKKWDQNEIDKRFLWYLEQIEDVLEVDLSKLKKKI